MLDWIRRVFDEFGKEKSLFFVQSLACIARTYQLAGNKPLVIAGGTKVQLAPASAFEVCILAAALACIREQDKVEDIARALFLPAPQLDLLMWLALKASAEDSVREDLPAAKELAKNIFDIDPVNQNEEFTAVIRQLQKHALLFSSIDVGLQAGDWRPQFLSDWVRAALLSRAWLNIDGLAKHSPKTSIETALARSQRARLAFTYLLPELVEIGRLTNVGAIVEILVRESNAGSPEASANYWGLRAGMVALSVSLDHKAPIALPPFTDLSDLSFAGATLGSSFSGTFAILVDAEFEDVRLSNCQLDQCDLTNVQFRNCHFEQVTLQFCDGPVLFEGCSFEATSIRNMRGNSTLLLRFVDCTFLEGCLITQDEPPSSSWKYGPVAEFTDCLSAVEAIALMGGVCAGIDPRTITGISKIEGGVQRDPAEACVRAMLKPFFPFRAGVSNQRQARGYIRSSAMGRGSMPPGSPSDPDLFSVLGAFGFTSGGRQAHMYAPWSSVAGASVEGVQLRNEMAAFLTAGKQGDRLKSLIERVRALGTW